MGVTAEVHPHLGHLIARQAAALGRHGNAGAATRGQIAGLLDLFTEEALDRRHPPPFQGLSAINANGLPFQWVLRFSSGSLGWGFLCELGPPGKHPHARQVETLRRVDSAAAILGMAPATWLADIARVVLPEAPDWPAHWRSGAWVGVTCLRDSIGLRPYFNLNRSSARERWLRVGRVLQMLGRGHALARLCALSGPCSPGSWPVGLALELRRDGGCGRVKIYFRSEATSPAWLSRWYEALELAVEAPVVRRALDLLGRTGAGNGPEAGFVVSLEVHADQSLSIKTDLAVTKWQDSDADVIEGCQALLQTLGGAPADVQGALSALGAWPPDPTTCAATRFVGIGCEPDGSRHMNLYLEPPLQPRPAVVPRHRTAAAPMVDAVTRGVAALTAARQGEHWEDFALPVGRSDSWVTAYVLTSLAEVLEAGLPAAPDIAAPALRWLLGQQAASGGWGYNASVPPDADTTAWVMLACRGWSQRPPRHARRFLLGCASTAGVATYPASDSPASGWARPSEDVAAVVRRALRVAAPPVDSLLPATWWTSPVYTSAMRPAVPAGRQQAGLRAAIAGFVPAGDFERALLLRCQASLGLPSRTLVEELLSRQCADGMWPAAARLRLARPELAMPWAVVDSGPLFIDDRAVFTTATVLAALGSCARLTARSATR